MTGVWENRSNITFSLSDEEIDTREKKVRIERVTHISIAYYTYLHISTHTYMHTTTSGESM